MDMNETPAADRTKGLLTVDLGPELKAAFATWCAVRKVKAGPTVRQAVAGLVSGATEPSTSPAKPVAVVEAALPAFRVVAAPDAGEKVRRELQLTPSEDVAVTAIAEARGYNFQGWVVAAIRAGLTGSPSFGQGELEALVASNRLVGQIAMDMGSFRCSNVWPPAKVGVDLENELRQHVESVSAVMAAGVRRWTIKVV